jgi:hypothetical protein
MSIWIPLCSSFESKSIPNGRDFINRRLAMSRERVEIDEWNPE